MQSTRSDLHRSAIAKLTFSEFPASRLKLARLPAIPFRGFWLLLILCCGQLLPLPDQGLKAGIGMEQSEIGVFCEAQILWGRQTLSDGLAYELQRRITLARERSHNSEVVDGKIRIGVL